MPTDPRRALSVELSARTGIDEAMIERVVHAFYARVREDALLGPIFDARVRDWDAHLAKMCDFWSSVTLLTGRYTGPAMQKHLPLPVDSRHFDHWLELFGETVEALCPPAAAARFRERAGVIAASLETGVAAQNGVRLDSGERLHRPDEEVWVP